MKLHPSFQIIAQIRYIYIYCVCVCLEVYIFIISHFIIFVIQVSYILII